MNVFDEAVVNTPIKTCQKISFTQKINNRSFVKADVSKLLKAVKTTIALRPA